MDAIDFRELSGTSRLFLDFINCKRPACEYYRYNFREISSYRQVAAELDKTSFEREKLAAILTKVSLSLNFPTAAKANIEKLARPDSLCVFSGQQVGMLLGPMYTVLKALTTYKLAQTLERELNRPVVPCFWLASDDHDFDEIRTVNFLDRNGHCSSVSYEPQTPPSGKPVADIALDGNINGFLDSVEAAMIQTEFSADIKSWLRSACTEKEFISQAFARLFNMLLGEFGIVPVDPNFPGMKELFKPVFQREIENHDKIFELFEKQSGRIVEAGYHRQVHKTASSLNLFINDGHRRNITADGQGYILDGGDQRLGKPELLALLNEFPERFSANVGLRPVSQCFVFPTVGQIVGPSEAAYYAQIEPMFRHHGVPWPVIRPRAFATLLEPQIHRIFRRLSIDFKGLIGDINHEIIRVIKDKFPSQIEERIQALKSSVEKPLIDLEESVKSGDIESYHVIEHVRKRIDHELNHLAKKLSSAHTKKHEDIKNEIFRAAAFLLPQGKFQERVVSPIYFANKFGPDLFAKLEQRLELDSIAHQIIEIEK